MFTRPARIAVGAAALGLMAGSAAAVSAATGGGGGRDGGDVGGSHGTIHESLSGYEEAPLALSTAGNGTFRAKITPDAITYVLTYADTVAAVTQAHIHFGATGQTGGISVFLCSNLGNGPTGTQACPAVPGSVSGTIVPANVIGPVGQGIAPGEYAELVAAIDAGTAYVNVHSATYAGGEIRAQIERGHQGHHH